MFTIMRTGPLEMYNLVMSKPSPKPQTSSQTSAAAKTY